MSCTKYDNDKQLGTVEGKIHSIVKSLQSPTEEGVMIPAYFYCNWAQANVDLDKVDYPTILYVLPTSGTLDFSWNQVRDTPNSQIAFVCPTDFDFDAEENEDIIERMKRLCIKFIRAVNDSGMFEQIEDRIPYRVLYDHLDQNVTGIVIEPTLEEVEGVSICTEPEMRRQFVKLEDTENENNG